MVRRVLCASVLLVGCGELRGSTEFTDAFFMQDDTAVADTRRPDASVINALEGDYYDEPIPETRAAFRLDRATDPDHPWIVFVSTSQTTAIACDLFRTTGWHQRLPTSSIVHIVELGSKTVATYELDPASPPRTDRAFVARTTQTTTPEPPLEKAVSGSVTITTYELATVRGNFDVTFDAYFPSDDTTDAGPVSQRVRGMFEVASCAVDW
jgi:hypothetical protein